MKARYHLTVFLLALVAIIQFGCFCQCEPEPHEDLQCKLVNSQGQNLVFGPQAIYHIDSLRVLRRRNDIAAQNGGVSKDFRDSTNLLISLDPTTPKHYLHYNRQTPNDSLEVLWNSDKRKCCGEQYTHFSIRQVTFNGNIIQPQNKVYTFVK